MALKSRPFFVTIAVLIAASLLLVGCAPRNTGTPGPDTTGTQQDTNLRGMNNGTVNRTDMNRTDMNRTNMQGNLMQNDTRNGYYKADENGRVSQEGANNQSGNNNTFDRNLTQNNLNSNITGNRLNNLNGDNDNTMADNAGAGTPGQTTANNNARAENIKKQLLNMPEVDDANCLVSGNTVIVGYKPSDNSGDVNATKSKIINMVKQMDKNADTVAVSESGDIMNQIQNITNNIANKSMTEINQEIRQLLQKINPATG